MLLGCLPATVFAAETTITVPDSVKSNYYSLIIRPKDSKSNFLTDAVDIHVQYSEISGTTVTKGKTAHGTGKLELYKVFFNGNAKGESYEHPVTITVTPKSGYSIESWNSRIVDTAIDESWEETDYTYKNITAQKDANGVLTISYTVSADDAIKACVEADPSSFYAAFDIVLSSSAPTSYDVQFFPRPEDKPSVFISKEVTGKATEPVLSEITAKFTDGYFSIMEPVSWYTKAPTENNGTYIYDETAKWDFTKDVTASMSLYAKNELKSDAKLSVVYMLPVQNKSVSAGARGDKTAYYDPAAKTVSDRVSYTSQLPINKALTAADIASTGAYSELLANQADKNDLIPARGATVTSWWYENKDGVWTELKAGTSVSKEEALYRVLRLSTSARNLLVFPEADLNLTVAFHPNTTGLTIDSWENTRHYSQKNNQPADTRILPADMQAAISQKIEKQEATDKTKLFRGWYLSDEFSDGSKVDLVTKRFFVDADLYARWVNAYTLTYDFGDYTPANASEFSSKTVGEGDYLTEPTTPTGVGIAFRGWYKDAGYKEAWGFAKDTITGNTVLYAKFEVSKQISVNFKYTEPDTLGQFKSKETRENVPVASGYQFGTLPELPGTKTTTQNWNGFENVDVITYVTNGDKRTLTYTGWVFNDKDRKEQELTKNTVLADYLDNNVNALDIYAKYDTSFKFTFDLGEGTTTNPNEVQDVVINAESGTIAKPTVEPTKEGWDFGGWVDASGNPFAFDKSYNENTTIKANWVAEKEYTVKFKLAPADAAITVKKQGSDAAIEPTAPVNENGEVTFKLTKGTYTWSVSADGYKSIQETLTVGPDYDETRVNEATLSAFQPVTRIALNIPNNQIMQKKSYDLSSLATVAPENASNKTIAWTVSGNDGVTLSEDGKTLTVSDTATGAVTLTATITNGKLNADGTKEENYTQAFTLTVVAFRPTITFAPGAGPAASDIQNMPEPVLATDRKISEPSPAPSASGWTFDGWYKEAACTTKWEKDDTFDADTTLYAKWTKNPVDVTITFAGGEGATLNTGASSTHNGKSGDKITLSPCMYTKSGYIFRSWGGTFAGTEYTLPEEAVTFTASWTQVSAAISEDDILHALDGLTVKGAAGNDVAIENIQKYKPQLLAVRDALAAGTATKTNATLIAKLSGLFEAAGLGPVSIDGDAKNGVSEVGAILSSDGAKVVLTVNKQATPGKTLPEAYQNAEYKSAWYSLSMTVGGATTEPKVPVILTMPIPAALSEMAADTIRVLLYKGAATEPVVMTPTVSGSNLTFAYDGNGQLAFVGKSISDAADTRVTALVMKYNGTTMGNVNPQGVIEPDENGNFTVLLPSTTSESTLQDLASGINSKWVTYMTVAPKATVKPSDGGAQNAEYWAKTGLTLTYSLTNSNKYSDSKTFTVTAENGTTRNFTVTVKKITSEDRTYKIAVANISGGTVTATPSPAAAGEEVKLTVTPNDGKKLIAGSLSYCLQSAGAKSEPINETTLTFIMPAGDININAQFEDDASAPLKNPPQITAFMINGVSAVINSDTKAITIILPYGTDLKHVAPTIVTANASKVEPSSAQRVDLSTPKAYRVYASNGAYVTYTVTAYTEEPSPTQSLWEKLQNQINSNPNWWELAEYQKKTGYYK